MIQGKSVHQNDQSNQFKKSQQNPHPISRKCCGGEVRCSAGNSSSRYLQILCTYLPLTNCYMLLDVHAWSYATAATQSESATCSEACQMSDPSHI